MNVCDAPDDHEVRRFQPVLQLLIADLFLSLLVSFLVNAGWLRSLTTAGPEFMAQFLDGDARTKNPAVRIECGLDSVSKSRTGFYLNSDVISFFQRNYRRLFQHSVNANNNRLSRFRHAGKGCSPELADLTCKNDTGLFGERRLIACGLRQRESPQQVRAQIPCSKKSPSNHPP